MTCSKGESTRRQKAAYRDYPSGSNKAAQSDGRRAHNVATLVTLGISLASEVALLDQRRSKVFHFAESQCHKLGVQRVRLKMAFERLPHGGDAGSESLAMGGVSVPVGALCRRIAVVEYDVSPSWQIGNERKRRKNGLLSQIRHNTQPCEKSLFCWIETDGS
jgi:hypothetical protein